MFDEHTFAFGHGEKKFMEDFLVVFFQRAQFALRAVLEFGVFRKFLQNSVDLADGLRAVRSLIVGELNQREPRVQRAFEGSACDGNRYGGV